MKLINKEMHVDDQTLEPRLVVTVSLPLETTVDSSKSEKQIGEEFVLLLKES